MPISRPVSMKSSTEEGLGRHQFRRRPALGPAPSAHPPSALQRPSLYYLLAIKYASPHMPPLPPNHVSCTLGGKTNRRYSLMSAGAAIATKRPRASPNDTVRVACL